MVLLSEMTDAVDEAERPFDDLLLVPVDLVAKVNVYVAFHCLQWLLTRLTHRIVFRFLL